MPGAARGLSWDRLKGAGAERAALLRAAAEDARCEAVLAPTEALPEARAELVRVLLMGRSGSFMIMGQRWQ